MGAYGDAYAITPRIDALLNRGYFFTNHHVQVSECAPSRVSMLSGRRPNDIQMFGRAGGFRTINPTLYTLPGYLRSQGYRTGSIGKVFDYSAFGVNPALEQRPVDMCAANAPQNSPGCSWDNGFCLSSFDTFAWSDGICPVAPNNASPQQWYYPNSAQGASPLVWSPNVPASRFIDSCIALQAVNMLNEFAATALTSTSPTGEASPFALFVGFMKPHLPWSAPKSFFDAVRQKVAPGVLQAYVQNGAPTNNMLSSQSQPASIYNNQEIRDYDNGGSVAQSDRIVAYYACMAHMDEQVGVLVDAIDALPPRIRAETHVVVWSDNGFQLGPSLWAKKTMFEQATRTVLGFIPSPNWVAAAGPLEPPGTSSDSPVESVDVMPTVLDLMGLLQTATKGLNGSPRLTLSGVSLIPIFRNSTTLVKRAAVSQYRSWADGQLTTVMGYTLRTRNYRIIGYVPFMKSCWNPNNLRCAYTFNKQAPKTKFEVYRMGPGGGGGAGNNFLRTPPGDVPGVQAIVRMWRALTNNMGVLSLSMGASP